MPAMTDKKKFSDQGLSQSRVGAGGSPNGETAAPPRRVIDGLDSGLRERLPDALVDELLAGAQTEQEIVGPGGLLAGLTSADPGSDAAEVVMANKFDAIRLLRRRIQA